MLRKTCLLYKNCICECVVDEIEEKEKEEEEVEGKRQNKCVYVTCDTVILSFSIVQETLVHQINIYSKINCEFIERGQQWQRQWQQQYR